MIARRGAAGQVYKPDWVDVLLAASLTAWATIFSVMAIVLLVPAIVGLDLTGVLGAAALLLSIAFFGFLMAILACVAIGLPALALASWLRLTTWWQAAIIGALAGVIFAPVASSLPGIEMVGGLPPHIFLFQVAGALAGIAAWRERKKGDLER